jgi:hypothetical protein
MKRLSIVLALAFLVAGALPMFAADQVFASYNKPNDVNLYAEVGWGGGASLGAAVGLEYIAGEFALGPVPFDWGFMGKGLLELGFPYLGVGAAAMATLHMGLVWNLDFYAGVGLGLSIIPLPVGFGFAQAAGLTYKLSDSMTLLFDQTYAAGNFVTGVGLKFKL